MVPSDLFPWAGAKSSELQAIPHQAPRASNRLFDRNVFNFRHQTLPIVYVADMQRVVAPQDQPMQTENLSQSHLARCVAAADTERAIAGAADMQWPLARADRAALPGSARSREGE